MQSSGFGNSVNALASLVVPYQLPVVLVISERGTLGEFNAVQVPKGFYDETDGWHITYGDSDQDH